jgi:hypothetical protein
MRIGIFGLIFAFIPGAAFANSCLPYLTPKDNSTGTTVIMTTLNKNGIASFSRGNVIYREQLRTPRMVLPPRWSSQADAPHKQYFADRLAAPPSIGFDPARPDLISIWISVSAKPQVEITLRSWGNGVVRFTGACSAGGVLHGSTPDVDYLISVLQNIVL